MAIVKMKRVTLLGLRSDRERLLEELQRLGCVQIEEVPSDWRGEEKSDQSVESVTPRLEKIRWALGRLSRFDQTPKPLFGVYPAVDAVKAAHVLAREKDVMGYVEQLEQLERRGGEVRAGEARAKASLDALMPWEGLDITGKDLAQPRTAVQLIGTVQTRQLPAVETAVSTLPATFKIISQQRDTSYLYLAYHHSAQQQVMQALEEAEFKKETIPQAQTPRQAIQDVRAQQEDLALEKTAIDEETRLAAAHIPELKILHDTLLLEEKKALAAQNFAHTEQAFVMRGWAPQAAQDVLRQRIGQLAPSASLQIEDPAEDENPPVILQNGPIATPFEAVVEGYSLPDYRGIDPTAVMTPFFANLFGMMVSDAGYGIIMFIAILIFAKVKKIPLRGGKMVYLLAIGGVATVLWGLLFNTIFGFSLIPPITSWLPLDPVNKPFPVMALCIGVGALHLFSGVALAAYMNIRRGDIVSAISDQLSWAMLLVGLGLLALPQTAAVGKWLAIAGALIILVMKGRDKRNPFKRLLSGLGALYGISGWLGDLLSYMRLFGMGLATGVIGMVFNRLIGMVWSGGIIAKALAVVLFVFCHLFNLGINVLGAYVHACRLQYIEFFGKFYQDGGRPFAPLNRRTRYVRIENAPAP